MADASVQASVSAQNVLHWTVPSNGNISGTVLRYRTDHFPTSATDGVLLLDDPSPLGTDRTYTHAGLTNGMTYYYAWYTYMRDASTFYSTAAQASATQAAKCDFDRDGDVDQEDFGCFQRCMTKPGANQDDSACAGALLDLIDFDVDADDLDIFLNCFRAARTPYDPTCAG